MRQDFHSGVFRHAVARFHDQIDPGGGHVDKLMRDLRKPEWEQELAEFHEEAAIDPEFEDIEDGY